MNGWQEPNDGKRIYLITDNTKMDGFTDYIKPEDIEHLYVTYSESRVNLGIHYYRNSLYSSNLVGICRIKSVDDETLYDAEGNELLIKVVPRFNVTVVELLNYIRDGYTSRPFRTNSDDVLVGTPVITIYLPCMR